MAGSPPGFFPVFLLADYQPIKRPIIPGRNSWGEMVSALPFLRRIYISSCLPTNRTQPLFPGSQKPVPGSTSELPTNRELKGLINTSAFLTTDVHGARDARAVRVHTKGLGMPSYHQWLEEKGRKRAAKVQQPAKSDNRAVLENSPTTLAIVPVRCG